MKWVKEDSVDKRDKTNLKQDNKIFSIRILIKNRVLLPLSHYFQISV